MNHAACDCSRRGFLGQLGAGFGTLAFQALLQQQSRAATSIAQPAIDPISPFAPRAPHFAPRAKSVIFLFLVGGPSQVDTFDYKPQLQKLDGQPLPRSLAAPIRNSKFANVTFGSENKLLGSPYRWRQYGESGMWVSDLFPEVAKHVDKLCFIHSMQADSNNHAPASQQFHTGDLQVGKASLGSWTTYGLGSENQDLPGYVVLFDSGPVGGAANYSNGFLPAAFQPTRLRDKGTPVLDLLPPTAFAQGQRDSLDLVRNMNLRHRESHAGFMELDARLASYELAYRMQSSALEVGNLDEETAATKRSYGIEKESAPTSRFGRKCLLARRLVERGVRFVQVYDMPDKNGWDAHSKLKENHETLSQSVDQPIAALLADLHERGLLDETLVIFGSEFGRTPLKQGDFGRNHNSAGFTIWLAGGGVRPGQRIGATDLVGYLAVDRPTPFKDLHATILASLGIRHEDLSFYTNGRQERLTGVAGSAKIIPGVLA